MKNMIFAALLALIPAQAMSQQVTYGSTTSLQSNVGSRITIQVQSNSPSVFSGRFMQTFSYLNGVTFTSNNFNFGGNANFNITNTINTNTFVFTNSPNFNWNR